MMTHEEIKTALTDSITNMTDGAGSDLEEAECIDDTWIQVHGALDVSQLASEVKAMVDPLQKKIRDAIAAYDPYAQGGADALHMFNILREEA